VTPTKKQKCVNDNKMESFSPTFFREEYEITLQNVVTPNIKPDNNEGIVKIIIEVANSVGQPINEIDKAQLLTWNKEDLRKKLGEYNKVKMEKKT